MKTPTGDDAKPKRNNLGPTRPAEVSSDETGKTGKARTRPRQATAATSSTS